MYRSKKPRAPYKDDCPPEVSGCGAGETYIFTYYDSDAIDDMYNCLLGRLDAKINIIFNGGSPDLGHEFPMNILFSLMLHFYKYKVEEAKLRERLFDLLIDHYRKMGYTIDEDTENIVRDTVNDLHWKPLDGGRISPQCGHELLKINRAMRNRLGEYLESARSDRLAYSKSAAAAPIDPDHEDLDLTSAARAAAAPIDPVHEDWIPSSAAAAAAAAQQE